MAIEKKNQEADVKDVAVSFDRENSGEMEEIVLSINRCTKVVKGGKNMSFGALIVIGDRKGKVGYGYGKANEVSDAIRKAQEAAKKNIHNIRIDTHKDNYSSAVW